MSAGGYGLAEGLVMCSSLAVVVQQEPRAAAYSLPVMVQHRSPCVQGAAAATVAARRAAAADSSGLWCRLGGTARHLTDQLRAHAERQPGRMAFPQLARIYMFEGDDECHAELRGLMQAGVLPTVPIKDINDYYADANE